MASASTRKREGGGIYTLLGLLAGAAIGGAVGLVYSPGSGEENRKRLAGWANNRVSEASSKAQSQAKQLRDRAESQAHELRGEAESRVEEIGDRVEARAAEVRDKAEEALPTS
jgi:gas vesicle protein